MGLIDSTLIKWLQWTSVVMGQTKITCKLRKAWRRAQRHFCDIPAKDASLNLVIRKHPITQVRDILQNNRSAIFQVLWSSRLRKDWRSVLDYRRLAKCTAWLWPGAWGWDSWHEMTLLSSPWRLDCGCIEQGSGFKETYTEIFEVMEQLTPKWLMKEKIVLCTILPTRLWSVIAFL